MAGLSPGVGVALPSNPDDKAQVWANETAGGIMPFSADECLTFVREALGLPGGEATAAAALTDAKNQKALYSYDPNSTPAGVPIFWSGPNAAGHVVLSAGNGMCYSTDIDGNGGVYYTSVASVSSWLGQQPAGWSNVLEGQSVSTDTGSGVSGTSGGTSILGISIPGASTVKNWIDRLGWFIFGGILLLMVLWKLGGS